MRQEAEVWANMVGIDVAEAETRLVAQAIAQRDRFECAFSTESGGPLEGLKNWRVDTDKGFDYRADAWFLRGAWHGWKLRDRMTGNDPFMGFILEGANEGEFAAYDYGCRSCEDAVRRVIDGTDTGTGSTNEPWNTLRKQLLEMKEKADRFDWLEAQRGLELVSERGGAAWKRPDGTMFHASHRLAAGGTQFSPQETLAATIDCARAVQKARGR